MISYTLKCKALILFVCKMYYIFTVIWREGLKKNLQIASLH